MRMLRWLLTLSFLMTGGHSMAESKEEAVASVLDQFHKAASAHDFTKYFGLMTADAVFIGTDASERWDVKAFKDYVKPHFDKGRGWTYQPKTRHINFSPDHGVAWFDEILENAKYGTCRGTGVLVKDGKVWKIAQYHLTIPVPNELASTVVKMIQAPKPK
ncbi:nuclear transport factor 2 family protein [Oligoflexus tunisiensis]|uniref:nuclear transport factor 2 family protein n=1 Tax=Oligoflexus tunisiensis TaxID=708132 RepID=UPI000A4D36FD|nr:nuclear transport factor 2 family protein [Oligoflexus tunisiensis]